MKKLTVLLILSTCLFTAHAQENKPNKEETVGYIFKTIQGAIGSELSEGFFVKEQTFDFKSYSLYNKKKSDWSGFTWEYEKIPWQEFKGFGEDTRVSDIITSIKVTFKIKVAGALKLWNSGGTLINKREMYNDEFTILCPTEKITNVKKAILRLVEIAKEENKDPFTN